MDPSTLLKQALVHLTPNFSPSPTCGNKVSTFTVQSIDMNLGIGGAEHGTANVLVSSPILPPFNVDSERNTVSNLGAALKDENDWRRLLMFLPDYRDVNGPPPFLLARGIPPSV